MSDFKFSKEERERIEEIRKKAKEIARKAKAMSENSELEEPCGKQTDPNDLDLMSDRKNDESE